MGELEMRFRVGDKVRIREFREEYRNQRPAFVREMEKLCGEEFTIDKINADGWIYYDGWNWHEDWLELAEAEAEEEFDIDPDSFDAVLLFEKG